MCLLARQEAKIRPPSVATLKARERELFGASPTFAQSKLVAQELKAQGYFGSLSPHKPPQP